jgi:transcriptional regulator with XRE-family HTH domain
MLGALSILNLMKLPSPLYELESYDPVPLLNAISQAISVKSDNALAKALGITQGAMSKIRNKHKPISAEVLLRMHDISGLSIRYMRTLMGDHRRFF